MQALDALPPSVFAGAAVTAVGLALVLVAEHAERPRAAAPRPSYAPRLAWLNPVFKPVASAGFLIAGFGHPAAFESAQNVAILVALTLGALGDVLLIPGRRPPPAAADDAAPPPPGVAFFHALGGTFRLGVLSFLASHLGYIVAFALAGLDPFATGIAAVPVAVIAVAVWRYLARHVPPHLKGSVGAYVAVISAMVAASFGAGAAAPAGCAWLPPAAALIFYASDLTVARQRFVVRRVWHRHVGLPLYYLAQLLFVALMGAPPR